MLQLKLLSVTQSSDPHLHVNKAMAFISGFLQLFTSVLYVALYVWSTYSTPELWGIRCVTAISV
jgi:hypothetical protein